MIDLNQLTGCLSNHVTERAKHCSAVKIRTGEYRVSPMTVGFEMHHGKAKRRVQFIMVGDRIKVLCSELYTGEQCEANSFHNPCCHAYAAYKSFLKSAEREARAA